MGFVEKNISKPEDIKGKTVATTPGDSMSQIWPLFLKKTGLKESDFKIGIRRRHDQAQRGDQRPGRSAARLRHGPEHEDQGCDRKGRVPDQVRRLRRQPGELGRHREQRLAEGEPGSREALHGGGDEVARGGLQGSEGRRAGDPQCQSEGRQDRHADARVRADHPALQGSVGQSQPAVQRQRRQHARHRERHGRIRRSRSQGEGRVQDLLHQRLSAGGSS